MIETIYAPPSMDGGEGVLAVVIRAEYSPGPTGAKFVSDPTDPVQVGVISKRAGLSVGAHSHPVKPATVRQHRAAVEVLVVRRGACDVVVYTSAFEPVATVRLAAGDCIVLRSGGHALTATADLELLEVKEGPYVGAADKRFRDESS